ncbi:MAG: SDR family NAD(P)-dependent oxidoreductase, partial [Acidobacteriia bacterium]|nr:SDR family NAD(P)-dependent oxidoreductase [Terriglobia bacterium]
SQAVAEAYQAGLPVRFAGLFAGEARRRISLPSYPFQRERYWLEPAKRRRAAAGHPLLGVRHEAASGTVTFETEVFPSDPEWLSDHQVFGRVIAPGALYGAMAAAASLAEGADTAMVEDLQLHNALVFPKSDSQDGGEDAGRTVQVVLDSSERADSRNVQIFSRGSDGGWTVHVEGRVSPQAPVPDLAASIGLESLKESLSPVDVSSYYRARAGTGIDLGPSFRTLSRLWSGPGEALGEVSFPETLGRNGLDVHPLVLDGCFQVVAAARNPGAVEAGITYLPFGWERLWLTGPLPDRVVCHVRMSETPRAAEAASGELPEVLTGEVRIYDPEGVPLGGLSGYTVKRATRAALLSAVEGVNDLLYEVAWRESALEPGISPADFLPSPAAVASRSGLLSDYLSQEGVAPTERSALLADLERWSRSRALVTLDKLGWERKTGDVVDADELRERLNVIADHKRVFRRMLEMLAKSGVLEEADSGFCVRVGSDDPLPDEMPGDLEEFADRMLELYPHGATEVGLFRRCGGELAEVLRGRADALTLLFSSGDPTPGDLYLKAPVARAANRILRETVQALVAGLPEGRRLKVLEVGAGTGSATAAILPELPPEQFDYVYTDISAGFFAEAEARFGGAEASIEYLALDIERNPVEQGFRPHGYDLLIASNVLHATRYLQETLAHCRELLAPSGHLVALENLSGQGWMDLTFGQLDGWWRFADDYRPHHALASPAVWRRALSDAGFREAEVLGLDESDPAAFPDKGVIVAQGPAEVTERPGIWVLAASSGDASEELAGILAAHNQTVVLAQPAREQTRDSGQEGFAAVYKTVETERRESWQSLFESLPGEIPLAGVVHVGALDGRGEDASTAEIAEDTRRVVASALALSQGLLDADATPEKGTWFLTRGAQVLERERGGQLLGATLWGFGKALARELPHLQPRMVDLDPSGSALPPELANELLWPDSENHIAHRFGSRQVARLVRMEDGAQRLTLPDDSAWVLAPDPAGVFERPCVSPLAERSLEPHEVRVAVEASGLNFWDVFRSLGFIEEGNLGREMCGHIVDVGSEVSSVSVGDHVVGLGFGAFAAQMVTHKELVAPAPPGVSVTDLATVPSAFVSAALSYEYSGLEAGERVLIHAGAGGVGLAAIQLAQAAGAEVFTTASAPKQGYLRSLGVSHVFDSRTTEFGQAILEATGGAGVDIVLNSLTGEGFIDASLSCLRHGGRFVELARRDILSEDEMASVRPDVGYAILELDVLKKTEPEWVGRVLRDIMQRLSGGQLEPLIHSRWPLAEAGAALRFMRSARHLGKIVVTTPPLAGGRLRPERTYLVTGGLGGIGCAVAGWLADRGAGTIVLNGRRPPDPEAEAEIAALRARGVNVRVELADVSDTLALNEMLARMDRELPPLGGLIHSVGVLSDGALGNQSWERFEQVLWPKVLGAWHLHRATASRDLDLFILFSSRVGVMGNPGQANHATANAFLDQLAAHRRALGLPGQAIAWGAWSDIGEAAEQKERIERQRAALGGRWFTPQQGIRAMEGLVRQDVTNSVVMSMDWEVFQEAVEDRPPLLEELLAATDEAQQDSPALADDLISRLQATPAGEREGLLSSFVQQELQAVLRLPNAPSPTVGFFDLGMDSLMAVELRNRLNRALADAYVASNTVVFDYPSVAALAGHLAEELAGVGAAPIPQAPVEPAPARQPAAPSDGGQIAIVGMACQFPGAPDLDAYWHLLEAGTDAVTDGRQDSGPWSGVAGDPAAEPAALRRGGFVEGLDRFDAKFFGIRPIEARTMDPRQRMLLETSWRALEDAGIDPGPLGGSRAGVYAGLTGGSEYRDLVASSGQDDSYLGTAASVALGRIAYTLGLMGPAVPVDATCASSLVAVHQAVAALQRGEVHVALAGGVQTALSPSVAKFMAEYGMLSKTGRCRTFDGAADGFVRGEGCGMVVLKRLRDAQEDGDRVWGVIRGSAVNQNGASAALTVPNGIAQEQLLQEALSRAGLAPADMDYVEAHGTGSQLGDPIEVRAVAAVYGTGRATDRPLVLGTAKTNIGHLEAAAGIAGLIKVMLAMKRGIIPRHLHFENPNPHIDWSELPVRVASEAMDWPISADRPPCAGVSAFAISGTNAHVIVEGYSEPGSGGGGGAGGRARGGGGTAPRRRG